MKTIAAQPGWNVVTHQSMHATVRTTVEIYREPVLAWHMLPTGEKGKLSVFAVTINGTISTQGIIFEKPDHTFVQPGADFWRDDEDVLKFFKDMLEMEKEGY